LDLHIVLSAAQIHDLAPAIAVERFYSIVEVHDDGARATWRSVNSPAHVGVVLPA